SRGRVARIFHASGLVSDWSRRREHHQSQVLFRPHQSGIVRDDLVRQLGQFFVRSTLWNMRGPTTLAKTDDVVSQPKELMPKRPDQVGGRRSEDAAGIVNGQGSL